MRLETAAAEQNVVALANTLDTVFERQRQAFRQNPPPGRRQRVRSLKTLESLLRDHRTALSHAMAADFGHRSRHEALIADVAVTLKEIRHTRQHLRSWMRSRPVSLSAEAWPAKAWLQYQPLGVVGVMAPWNYPVNLVFAPLAAALAAGNRVMVKPSEHTPETSRLMEELLTGAFDATEVAVVQGGVEVSAAFSALPFDHLFFTGSPQVGRLVMRAAAANLTPVTLELGGKSPAVVAKDYGLEDAAGRIGMGRWFNAGQTCIAPDYVLLEGHSPSAFAEALGNYLYQAYQGRPDGGDYTHIINDAQFRRLEAMLEDAQARGATVLQPLGSPDPGSRLFPPAIVTDVSDEMRVMQEEIFGPILPLLEVDGLEQAIAHINAGTRPLAMYLFTNNRKRGRKLLERTVAGGVSWNDTLIHFAEPDLPFGGVGDSGMGQYHGHDGFLTFSKKKPVLKQARWPATALLRPPYGKLADRVVRWLLK